MVGVIIGYAKLAHHLRYLDRAVGAHRHRRATEPTVWRSHRLADRVPADVRQEIVDSYRDGVSAHLLADRHGISRNAVLGLVAEAGVPRHIRRMSDADTDEAVRLYQQGLSFVSVGKQIGFGPTAVADAVKRKGLVARPRRGMNASHSAD